MPLRLYRALCGVALAGSLSAPISAAAPRKPAPAKPAPEVTPDAPITVSHAFEQEGWNLTTKATVGVKALDLDVTAHRQDAGGLEIDVHATSHLENFHPVTSLELKDGSITRFGYVNRDVQGTIDLSWTASKKEKGVGTIEAAEQVLRLPPLAELNQVPSARGVIVEGIPCAEGIQCLKDTVEVSGLGIAGQGDAALIEAEVVVQKWWPRTQKKKITDKSEIDSSYGGVLGLAAHYQYMDDKGQPQLFTAYIEYEHLITGNYLPRRESDSQFIDEQGQRIDKGAYSGCRGLGATMADGELLKAADLAKHPLIGYLGATETPHVHIQASFSLGKRGYLQQRLFDPSVLLAGH